MDDNNDLKNIADQLTNKWDYVREDKKQNKRNTNSSSIVLFASGIVWTAYILLSSLLFMFFWNVSIPNVVSSAPSLSYLESLGLLGVCRIFISNCLPILRGTREIN